MLYHTLRCGLTPLFHSTETDFFYFAVALDVKNMPGRASYLKWNCPVNGVAFFKMSSMS